MVQMLGYSLHQLTLVLNCNNMKMVFVGGLRLPKVLKNMI
jgi:hypothetical protein